MQPAITSTQFKCPECGRIAVQTELWDGDGKTIKTDLVGFRRESASFVCDQCGERFPKTQ